MLKAKKWAEPTRRSFEIDLRSSLDFLCRFGRQRQRLAFLLADSTRDPQAGSYLASGPAAARPIYFGLFALPVFARPRFETAVDVGGAVVRAAAALLRRTPG